MKTSNRIAMTRNRLLVLGDPDAHCSALSDLMDRFCGVIVRSAAEIDDPAAGPIYVAGDVGRLDARLGAVRVVREVSSNLEALQDRPGVEVIGRGRVPLLVHGVGVMFERFFDAPDLFERVRSEHVFQHLTESTKASTALRKGIYLTDVAREVAPDGREILRHRLLRCSSNLSGPTDNLRETDRMILDGINAAAHEVFEQETSLNHVLAQIYENRIDDDARRRERKAKISAHSDKTKDMRADGLIAFCTFYDPAGFAQLEPSATDPGDWCHRKRSGLTSLHFRLKGSVDAPGLAEEFSVKLRPNSVFMIPLSTNRLYTHAIRPSVLNVARIPTRMGYVVRSSSAEARFVDGHVELREDGQWVPLQPMTRETLADLRSSYYRENATADDVAYGKVHFSMNAGDYQKPLY